MSEVDQLMKERGLQFCKEFLGGVWSTISMDDFHIEPISGGLSNILFSCSISEKIPISDGEQRLVLLRLYGRIIQENPETVVTDSVIFGLLAEKKLGPKLYGVFTGGRVEEYIPSRHLYTRELHDTEISRACAKVMANFHKLSMPLCKKPKWLFDTIDRYLDDALSNVTFDHGDMEDTKTLQKILSYDLPKEVDSLKAILSQVESPVRFCHNDFQEGNILFVEKAKTNGEGLKSWEVRAIDFEYCSYNYRGFDIGNHFCEWCYDYSVREPPFYSACLDNYPNRDQQVNFARAYLDEEEQSSFDSESSIDHLLLEANAFALASHMLWGLWSIVQSQMSTINFKYLDYALVRLEHYMIQKSSLPKLGQPCSQQHL